MRNKNTTSSYHTSKSDYRNIAIPKMLHKKLAHIAIDCELSASEITTMLVEEFCNRWDRGETEIQKGIESALKILKGADNGK